MNKEEILNKYIDLIDKGYCSDCNELNCIDNFPHAKITHGIRELQQENQSLKKQLEEYKYHLNCAKEMLEVQGRDGNYNYDSYMLGLYNGMEYTIALFETREPIYRDGKDIEFLSNKNQQKEFIKYLEDEIKNIKIKWGNKLTENGYIDIAMTVRAYQIILQKYKEIIGGKE